MFKHDTMERYVADSLKKQSEPAEPSFDFFRSGEGVVLQFRLA